MRVGLPAFNGLVRTYLIRRGTDERLPGVSNTFYPVYREMLLQIARDYPGLPDARTLRAREILFFYDGLRDELKKYTMPR